MNTDKNGTTMRT